MEIYNINSNNDIKAALKHFNITILEHDKDRLINYLIIEAAGAGENIIDIYNSFYNNNNKEVDLLFRMKFENNNYKLIMIYEE